MRVRVRVFFLCVVLPALARFPLPLHIVTPSSPHTIAFLSYRLNDHVCKAPHVQGSGRRGKHHEISHARALPSEVDRADVRSPLRLYGLHHLVHVEVYSVGSVMCTPHVPTRVGGREGGVGRRGINHVATFSQY